MVDERQLIHSFVTDLNDCAIVMLDADGRVQSWNTGAQVLFKYSAPDALGRPLSSLIADWDDEIEREQAFLQDVRTWGKCSETLYLRTGDKRDVAANVIVKALRDTRRQFVGYGLLARASEPPARRRNDTAVAVDLVAGKRRKILLVDDDHLARETIESMLISDGHDVLTASDGRSAIDVISSVPDIDLMLTDVVMPGMSGPALAEEARKLASDLKILFISGYLPAALVDQGTLGNSADVLVKPFRAHHLAQRVESMFAAS